MKLDRKVKKRLILVDLDGTVLDESGTKIHPITRDALIKAQKDGHNVCIITGRPHRASKRFYSELELDTLLTNFDGAHIHDPKKRKFKRIILPISEEITKEIINNKIIKENTETILLEYVTKAIASQNDQSLETFFHLDDVEGDEYFVDEVNKWDGPSTNIVLKLKSQNALDHVLRSLEEYHNTIKIQTGRVYGQLKQSGDLPMISLTNKLATKAYSAEILAQYYNCDMRDVIAFGDQMNDFQMLKAVGYGIAMKNGNPDLKNIATGITFLTNDEGGVGDYLTKLLNGENV
ncbi:Cof-type HAD-IIB family hydrolase [Spiroplasma endosymbiont of Labia minor]|uniref:Cof-type HAD-IIB family hydrolase n=1 Tax=Spiroplasma endosymbiont of Labia minor TaxID=3066305 RepID=UPI0030CBA542